MARRRCGDLVDRSRRQGTAALTSVLVVVAVVASLLAHPPGAVGAADPCEAPANEVVAENCLPGSPASEWDVEGAGDPTIQGFATDISVDQGQTVDFKIDTTATNYRIDIYRLGYYGGDGARQVATIATGATTETDQPNCQLIDGTTDDNLVDCGNWGVSASWPVPAGATSGIYVAKPTRADDGGASHIVFIVRDDDGGSDVLFQTADTTWQAYNRYGGYSLYDGPGHAHKVSYNRPFTTRGTQTEDWLFNAEYPMLRWLERNGYDVSYSTGVDSDRRGAEILEHEAFLSVGHDEYWSAGQRTNVEAARDAGVDLAFFSGNEVYWKTRWEPSTADGGSTDRRTLVAYKEGDAQGNEHYDCLGDFACDPDPDTWTGLWRQNAAGHDGGRPENALSGQISWHDSTGAITVPAAHAPLRFWRNTSVADLTSGSATLAPETLGYEWNPEQPAFASTYPPGRVLLSRTEADGETHQMSLHRAPSGALVFGAGTVQWSWGLDPAHDRGSAPADPDVQQATVNLLSDMGAQPASLQPDLVPGGPLDSTPPTATITEPVEGSTIAGGTVTISGTAADGDGVVAAVEVSTDGGTTWTRASGTTSWSHSFGASAGEVTAQVRAVDDAANLGAASTVTFDVDPQACPCSIFGPAVTGTEEADDSAVELGVRFRSDVAGFVTGIRFYKTAGNTGSHTGTLWSNLGVELANVSFSGESATGWQEATFDAPVAIDADTTYVASYHTTSGRYATGTSFAGAGVDAPPLHALADGVDGRNGVYAYGGGGVFPTSSFGSSNYLVDVAFVGDTGPDTTAPTITQRTPAPDATGVAVTADVSARFNEPMAPASISGTTVELRDPSDAIVDATVSYHPGTRSAIIDPNEALAHDATYTATVSGGAGGVADVAGNHLASDVTWTFTTAAPPPPPPDEGPGGPVLIVSSAANPFSRFYVEILRNEGLNAFDAVDISSVTPALLADHSVVVLGEVAVDTSQADMLATWVADGGNLIAMRPDPDLAGLVGLTDAGTDLSEAYLDIDTSPGLPGAGLVDQTIQFHGTADRYEVDTGTDVLATLYSGAATPTTNPAVTLRSVGSNGGQVAAFTFDLARSVVHTRQGNPEWAGEERDGQSPPILRSDDLFFPDWIDFSKVQIPQADEQQRLLANLVEHVNRDVMPLPRFWYLPRGERAAVVMTGDDHGGGGTAGQFDWAIAASPPGCDVDQWECVRGTSYLYPSAPLSDAAAASYQAQGFEVGVHVSTNCANWTPTALEDFYSDQLAAFASAFPSAADPATHRTHCITWSDWATQPKVERAEGIRLDTNYYYWPGSWVDDRPGYFTGSGLPMRFADLDGSLIDVYQAATQMPDESDLDYARHISTLLDNALGAPGYYGVVTTNMHTDSGSHPGQQAVVAAAKARGVPVVSARQMLTWLDGRNASSFEDLAWSGNEMTFSIAAAHRSGGLQAMLPTQGPSGSLESLTLDGAPVAFATQTVKGIEYAVFTAGAGGYAATYDLDTTAPTITSVQVVSDAPDEATVRWTTDEPATSRVQYGTAPASLLSSVDDPELTTSHEVRLTGLDPSTTYHLRVSSTDGAGNTSTSPAPPATESFATPTGVATDTTVADFGAGTTAASTYVADTSGGEVILAPAVGTELDGTSIPTGWSTGSWSGGTTQVADGRATVDGSWVRSDALVGAGRAVEFSGTFSGSTFQNAGLGVELDGSGESWAMFGTNATTGVLQARTLDVGGSPVDVALGSQYIGSAHRFRIEWDASVRFYVDGTLVHTAATVGGSMRPIASDFATGGGALHIDWMRMTPHASPGTFLSRIHDSGSSADWGALGHVADLPADTTATFSVRTGSTPLPDDSWTTFTPLAEGDDVPSSGRYLQYRIDLTSASGRVTPAISSVTIPYTAAPDTTAPTITTRSPAPDATDIAIGTSVTVTFDEPIDPTTDWPSVVALRAEGSATDVPATVTYAGTTATLEPAADLAPDTRYTVTVAASVADVAGNTLGATATWSFTTSPPLESLVDDTASDFGAGSTTTGTYVSVTDDGEVILAPEVGAEMTGTSLPPGWTSTLWSGGPGGSTVGGGLVTVDGALVATDEQVGPGRSLEFVGTFGAASFQHAGFGVDLNNVAAWAMFSTHNTGGSTLYARTHNGSAAVNVPLGGGLVGSPHRYRIDWSGDEVVFWVDGVIVHTQPVAIATDMRPVVSDFAAGGASVGVDWMRMLPYAASGTFTSRVLDAGERVDWRTLDVTASVPAGTEVEVEVRTGDTPAPDGTWSAFAAVAPGGDVPGRSRYVQYRLQAGTTDPLATPVVERVALGHVVPPPDPIVSAGGSFVVEGDEGAVALLVPVRLSAASGATVTVDWATIAGTDPVPGVDYESASGTVTFAPGETEKVISITVLGDIVDEPGQLWGAEWLGIALSSPTNAVFGPGFFARLGLGLIVDDDPPPVVSADWAFVVEGDEGTVTMEVPVRLSAPSAQTVTVEWATGTASVPTPGVDFEAASGTVTFAPGQVVATISVTVIGDVVDEPGQLWGAEWLAILLSSPTGAQFGTGLFAQGALALIVDDD